MKKIILTILLSLSTIVSGQVKLQLFNPGSGDVNTSQLADSTELLVHLQQDFWHWYTSTDWVSFFSSQSAKPLLSLTNSNSDGEGVRIQFLKGVIGAADDTLGSINSVGSTDGMLVNSEYYARSLFQIADPTAGSRDGKWALWLAQNGALVKSLEANAADDTFYVNSNLSVEGTYPALVDTAGDIRQALSALSDTPDMESVFESRITDTVEVTTGGTFEKFPEIISATYSWSDHSNFDDGDNPGTSIVYTDPTTRTFTIDFSFNIVSIEPDQNVSIRLDTNSVEVNYTTMTSHFKTEGESKISRILTEVELSQNDTLFFMFTSDTNSDSLLVEKIVGKIEENR